MVEIESLQAKVMQLRQILSKELEDPTSKIKNMEYID